MPVADHLQAFADMADVELVLIDEETRLRQFRNELRWNEAAYLLGPPGAARRVAAAAVSPAAPRPCGPAPVSRRNSET